jgi:phytoene synthase
LTLESYAAKAAPPLSDNWYARLFAPRERRTILTAAFACATEIEECGREAREPAVARLKLAWWREEIDLLAAGEPRHPVTLALAGASTSIARANDLWLALIAAAERGVDLSPHLSAASWNAHWADAGALHELLALAFDAGATARAHARELGAAVANARGLCSARREAMHGRIELPLELLARSGLDPEDLAGEWPPPAIDLLARMSAEGRTRLDAALAAIPASTRPQLQPCLIMAALQDARLAAFVAHGHTSDGDAVRPVARLWTAWRAARRALRTN